MNHVNHVNWAALVEHEANERAHVHQERLFGDIRRDGRGNMLEELRYAVHERQSKLTSPKGAVRWRMLRLRSVLAKLL